MTLWVTIGRSSRYNSYFRVDDILQCGFDVNEILAVVSDESEIRPVKAPVCFQCLCRIAHTALSRRIFI